MATRKRRDPESHVPSKKPNPRTLAQFHREVVSLLKTSHRIPSEKGVRYVAKYRDYVRDAWRIGKPPCYVADNIARKVSSVGLSRRDPENPSEGEVYESKAGTRWRVVSVNRDKRRVKVRRAGFKDYGDLEWNPSVLAKMTQLQTQIAREITEEGPRIPSAEENPKAFKGWLSGLGFAGKRDPQRDGDGRARRYHVYVIESMHNDQRTFYVGQSAHTPAERLKQHKQGVRYCKGCTKRSYARGTKMRLCPEFYKRIPVIRSREQAERVERLLARKLRSFGFHVEGGH